MSIASLDPEEVVEKIRELERAVAAAVAPSLGGTREEQTMALSAMAVALCRAWYTLISAAKGQALTIEELAEVVRSSPWEAHAKTAMLAAVCEPQETK